VLVGTGFLALDLLYRDAARSPARRYAGGSFGNVMAILAYFGWKSYPVARLGTGPHARTVLDDLEEFRVDTKFVCRARTGATPLIVVRVAKKVGGGFQSRFEWRHPRSGGRLPSYRPLPKFVAAEVSPNLPTARVFYFDRAEPSSLLLATTMSKRGALVYFEPSSCKDERMFTACMAVSDVVKYSAERIPQPPRNPDTPSPRLEIQTLGSAGLRYRLKEGSAKPGPWRNLAAHPAGECKDSTGCGDWTSAGFLNQVGRNGRKGFLCLDENSIVDALSFGQALAAVNSEFEGARGPMYALKSNSLLARVAAMRT
jgi:sugar/nucleoside kinase (ribokinase family)